MDVNNAAAVIREARRLLSRWDPEDDELAGLRAALAACDRQSRRLLPPGVIPLRPRVGAGCGLGPHNM